jgi:hypothetical protein
MDLTLLLPRVNVGYMPNGDHAVAENSRTALGTASAADRPVVTAESPNHQGQIVRAALAALVSILAAVAVIERPAICAWYSDPFRGIRVSHDVFDPRQLLNETVSLPRVDDQGRSIPPNRPVLLAPAPCGSCTDPRPWTKSLQGDVGLPIVAVLAGPDPDVEASLNADAPHVFRIGSHATGRLPRRLVDISPLFAAANAHGRIVAVSSPGEGLTAFYERAGLR